MIVTQYVCPRCGVWSGHMKLLSEKWDDSKDGPWLKCHPTFQPLSKELLLCPCGMKLPWRLMVERTVESPRDESE